MATPLILNQKADFFCHNPGIMLVTFSTNKFV